MCFCSAVLVVGAGKLGDEALQALSSKEDLQGVVLRKTDITSPSPGLSNQWFPFKPLMLLQVKGIAEKVVNVSFLDYCKD